MNVLLFEETEYLETLKNHVHRFADRFDVELVCYLAKTRDEAEELLQVTDIAVIDAIAARDLAALAADKFKIPVIYTIENHMPRISRHRCQFIRMLRKPDYDYGTLARHMHHFKYLSDPAMPFSRIVRPLRARDAILQNRLN